MKLIRAELKDRIEITVKHDWDLRFLSDLAHAIEYAVDRCARGECPLRGQLIDNSIRERIGERESKLDQVRAGGPKL